MEAVARGELGTHGRRCQREIGNTWTPLPEGCRCQRGVENTWTLLPAIIGCPIAPFLSFTYFVHLLTRFAPLTHSLTPLHSPSASRCSDYCLKITAVIRSGVTWHVHNSTAVTSRDVLLHTASFMAITEFDGRGGNVYSGVRFVDIQTL